MEAHCSPADVITFCSARVCDSVSVPDAWHRVRRRPTQDQAERGSDEPQARNPTQIARTSAFPQHVDHRG